MTARVLLEMPDDLQAAIDERRGLVPRNAWLRAAVEHYLACDRLAIHVPEPTPSKAPPPREEIRWSPPTRGVQTPIARSTEEGERKVLDPPPDHEFKGQKVAPNRCGVCGVVKGRHS